MMTGPQKLNEQSLIKKSPRFPCMSHMYKFSLPHLKPTSLITCYKKYLWLERGKTKIPQEEKKKKQSGTYLGINICNCENNDIFLLHLALHDTSMCQADAATRLHLPVPCNHQYQVVALIHPCWQDQKARFSLLHSQVHQNRSQKFTGKA